MKKIKSITDHIREFLELFPQMTKDESDFIDKILNWPPEKIAGFKLAKSIFEFRNEEELSKPKKIKRKNK